MLGGRPFHRVAATVADRAARRAFHRGLRKAYLSEFGERPPRDIWPGPNRLEWGGLVGLMIVSGVAIGFASFGVMFALGGAPEGTVDTPIERIGVSIFLFGWAMAMGSPLWAWLITKAQNRLPTTKRKGALAADHLDQRHRQPRGVLSAGTPPRVL